jgi:hypothetical protein
MLSCSETYESIDLIKMEKAQIKFLFVRVNFRKDGWQSISINLLLTSHPKSKKIFISEFEKPLTPTGCVKFKDSVNTMSLQLIPYLWIQKLRPLMKLISTFYNIGTNTGYHIKIATSKVLATSYLLKPDKKTRVRNIKRLFQSDECNVMPICLFPFGLQSHSPREN